MRVLICKSNASLRLSSQGPVTIKAGNKILKREQRLEKIVLKRKGDSIKLGRGRYKTLDFISKGFPISVNNKAYRGNIKISVLHKQLFAVNYVDIEGYLKSVVPSEMPSSWPMEALKAQAVVARTYALYRRAGPNKEYDLCSGTNSQMYKGVCSERSSSNMAVYLTEKMCLYDNRKLVPTYFHSTCGGQTINADSVWRRALDSIEGVDCKFCKDSPHYKWKRSIGRRKLGKILSKKGYKIGKIKKIKIGKDKLYRIFIEDKYGKSQVLDANKFRILVGTEVVRSSNFRVKVGWFRVKFKGNGWGHCVGLCQWGARGMALKGHSYKQILQHYYPNLVMRRLF
ncbi:SpoIID/LytB domain-containing protein [bacterium]|nr:SpoIID/LytB domain-containing protein [bacterium]